MGRVYLHLASAYAGDSFRVGDSEVAQKFGTPQSEIFAAVYLLGKFYALLAQGFDV